MKKSVISVLKINSRYLQSSALKGLCSEREHSWEVLRSCSLPNPICCEFDDLINDGWMSKNKGFSRLRKFLKSTESLKFRCACRNFAGCKKLLALEVASR